MFAVAGRSAITSASANECVCNLWNPSSDRSIWVTEFYYSRTSTPVSVDPLRFCRTSTAGTTPGSTITPGLDSDYQREVVPVTGVVLHLANFATEPVLASPDLYRLVFPSTGVEDYMFWLFPEPGLRVPPGSGLALASTGATAATASDITFRFYE